MIFYFMLVTDFAVSIPFSSSQCIEEGTVQAIHVRWEMARGWMKEELGREMQL